MALIKSISGIRGTIGGPVGEGLTPLDVVKFTAAYATYILQERSERAENGTLKDLASEKGEESPPEESKGLKAKPSPLTIVIGRDARLSGPMVTDLVRGTLVGMGFNVVDLGLSTTPTVEMAVTAEGAAGGIILTASHNPKQWNALKLLNHEGEFLSAEAGERILAIAADDSYSFADVEKLGSIQPAEETRDYLEYHIEQILALPYVDVEAIRAKDFHVAIDCVNSTGGIALHQ